MAGAPMIGRIAGSSTVKTDNSLGQKITSNSPLGYITQNGQNYYLTGRENGMGTYQLDTLSGHLFDRFAPISGTEPYDLGVNEQYRTGIDLAGSRTGLNGATIAAVISAEADMVKGVWQADSYNSKSGAAGITQFLPNTWLGEAVKDGTYVNERARALGYIDDKNKILDRKSLLALRTDATTAIVAAAEYDKEIFDSLSTKRYKDGSSLIPTNLSADQTAQYLYLGHHEGAVGAAALLTGTISEKRAREKLFPQNVPKSQQTKYLNNNNDSYALAYTSFIWDYTKSHIKPSNFQR
jgi:hypothetical protein